MTEQDCNNMEIDKRVIIFRGHWDKYKVRDSPDHLYVFGDNDISSGKGGQAIIRDEPNSIGLPTKKYPNNMAASFYSDVEYDTNVAKINIALQRIAAEFSKSQYTTLVIPAFGFGTGFSKLPELAPKTYDYLKLTVNAFVDSIQENISQHIKWR
jgi:hypothetical protein